jgi:hypothetical protein
VLCPYQSFSFFSTVSFFLSLFYFLRLSFSSGFSVSKTTNQRSNATGNCSSLEKDGSSLVEDGGRDEEESKPSLVTSSELIGSDPGQDVVQEEATPDQVPFEIPSGWTRVKLEPDCYLCV